MAQNPIGTVTDDESLVPLVTREAAFLVDVTEPARIADLPEGGTVVWRLREEGDVPRLAFAPVDDPDEAGALYAAELSEADGTLTIEVPEPLLADGLGLDTQEYDDDNPLLFKAGEITEGVAVGLTPEGEPAGAADVAIELVPVRFADGTPYRDEPIDDSEMDSDPVAEAELARDRGDEVTSRSETISAPIDAAFVDEVLETTDAPRTEVVRALETISRHDLVDVADDDTAYDPLTVDDRALIALDDDSWSEKVVSALDASDSVVTATREIHARQADDLLRRAEEDRERFEDRTPVVVQPNRTSKNVS